MNKVLFPTNNKLNTGTSTYNAYWDLSIGFVEYGFCTEFRKLFKIRISKESSITNKYNSNLKFSERMMREFLKVFRLK